MAAKRDRYLAGLTAGLTVLKTVVDLVAHSAAQLVRWRVGVRGRCLVGGMVSSMVADLADEKGGWRAGPWGVNSVRLSVDGRAASMAGETDSSLDGTMVPWWAGE